VNSDDLERISQFADALNRRDIDALTKACTADVVFWTFLSGRTIPAEPFRGSDGIIRWIEGEADAFSRAEVQDIQIRELDTDLTIGVARVSGVGRESEIEVTGHAAWLFEMRAGRIARWRPMWTRPRPSRPRRPGARASPPDRAEALL
jgi:ketosteroid isomerase-like protein